MSRKTLTRLYSIFLLCLRVSNKFDSLLRHDLVQSKAATATEPVHRVREPV